MSTNKIHVFRYQPDLPDTVIYWSMTFVFFFLSMIGLMEEQGRINLFSVITFLIFLGFGYLGTRRKMILTNEQLKVFAIMKKNRYQIDLEKIQKISIGSHGITITTNQKDYAYVMFPRSKNALVEKINEEKAFQGNITGIKKSVD
ncbi:hypothetical protein DOK76_04135 [Vagococcus sp. DIV0080]|uniref:Pore-forming protein n=1 Tax=Candidatus Vagococcus giribetii TaxID=2230876 RepID=A0ABS3HRJ3_9ENTE|nr:EbsA family protein [Vagococcus sp. DIV0080]MBO0476246.1 hypothetical protein [Vagococcus sp. DIV0080]